METLVASDDDVVLQSDNEDSLSFASDNFTSLSEDEAPHLNVPASTRISPVVTSKFAPSLPPAQGSQVSSQYALPDMEQPNERSNEVSDSEPTTKSAPVPTQAKSDDMPAQIEAFIAAVPQPAPVKPVQIEANKGLETQLEQSDDDDDDDVMVDVPLQVVVDQDEAPKLEIYSEAQNTMDAVFLEAQSPEAPKSVSDGELDDEPAAAASPALMPMTLPSREALHTEHDVLVRAANEAARVSAEITPEMIADVQELLRMFGIPYIVSPSEAEAQCAQLEQLGLTQGTITDDNDIFLFGGKRVYRHVCSRSKNAQRYNMADVEKTLCKQA